MSSHWNRKTSPAIRFVKKMYNVHKKMNELQTPMLTSILLFEKNKDTEKKNKLCSV